MKQEPELLENADVFIVISQVLKRLIHHYVQSMIVF